jgi:hypothetical protein
MPRLQTAASGNRRHYDAAASLTRCHGEARSDAAISRQ